LSGVKKTLTHKELTVETPERYIELQIFEMIGVYVVYGYLLNLLSGFIEKDCGHDVGSNSSILGDSRFRQGIINSGRLDSEQNYTTPGRVGKEQLADPSILP